MESFPIPASEPPTTAQAIGQLGAQDALVGDIMGSLAGAVGAQIGEQAAKVAAVQDKLVGALQSLSGMIAELVGDVMASIYVASQAQLQAQQSLMNAVVGTMVGSSLEPTVPVVLPGAPILSAGSAGLSLSSLLPGAPTLAPAPYGHVGAPAHLTTGAEPSAHTSTDTTSGTGTHGAQPGAPSTPYTSPGIGIQSGPSPGAPISAPTETSAPVGSSPAPTGPTGSLLDRGPSAPPSIYQPTGSPGSYPGTGGPATSPPGAPAPAQGVTGSTPAPGGSIPPPCPPPVVQCPTPVINVYTAPPCPTGAEPVRPATPAAPRRPREIDVEPEGAEKPDLVGLSKIVCDRIAPLVALIPVPIGGPKWCAAMPLIRDGLTALGSGILGAVCKAFDGVSTSLSMVSTEIGRAGAAGPEFMQPLFDALRDIVLWSAKVSSVAYSVCKCLSAIAALKGACAPGTLIGLAVARGLIAAIRSIQVGTTIPVRLSTTLGILIPQVERVLDYVTEYACPTRIPSPGDARSCFLEGTIDESTYVCWLLCGGEDPIVWDPVLIAQSKQLGDEQWIELAIRRGMTADQLRAELRNNRWLRKDDLAGLLQLYEQLPSISDITRWARNGALTDAASAKWGLDEGWAEILGSTYPVGWRSKGIRDTTALGDWRAHWRLPGAGEAREWLHRLRPGRKGVTKPFTDQDYSDLLRSGDMAPAAREWAFETRYREFSPADILRMNQRHMAGPATLIDAITASGYSYAQAQMLERLHLVEQTQATDAALYGYSPKSVARMVRLGVMSQATATGMFARWGYDPLQAGLATKGSVDTYDARLREQYNRLAQRKVLTGALKAYQIGTLSHQNALKSLEGIGMQSATAAVLLNLTDAAAKTAIAQQTITMLRGAYFSGRVTLDQARNALHVTGISPQRVEEYTSAWAQEFRWKQKTLTAAEIISLYKDGLIQQSDAETRLQNLGYKQPDATLKLQDAALKILGRRVKAEAALEKGGSGKNKTLAALASDAHAQAEKLLRASEKDAPVKSVQKWYQAGAITVPFAQEMLVSYGYTPTAAERLVATWAVGGIETAARETEYQPKTTGSGLSGGHHAGHHSP